MVMECSVGFVGSDCEPRIGLGGWLTQKRVQAQKRAWYASNSEKVRRGVTEWRVANSERLREYARERYVTSLKPVKAEAMATYGDSHCVCCGETEIAFLTLDHVDGGGSGINRRRGSTYAWLKRNGWPSDPPLQVLCFNCNCGRQVNGGVCPHQSGQLAVLDA
jgi:hypothetical protein